MKWQLVSGVLCWISAGCADTSGSTSPSSPSRLAVQLTDAPAAFDHVWVDIASVELESPTGWLTLADQPARFDLLALQNNVTAALGGAQLEPGDYGQLRLIVDQASVEAGGVETPLTVASGAQTGIKIDLATTVEAGMTYTVVLDYDASKSIKTTGQGYLMTPVITVKSVTGTM